MEISQPNSPGAIIFDMDDLLVRSAPIWQAAEATLLTVLGQPWTAALAARYKGMNAPDVARIIHETHRPELALADCQRILRESLIAGFAGAIQPMPGAVALVQRLTGRVPMAVASGSPLSVIEHAVQTLGLRPCFARLISSERVSRGKPHPDVFLAAATALNAPPASCLVFEDSLIGVRAAQAAGMRCYCVPSGHHAEIARLATRVFKTLAEVTITDVFGNS